MLPALAIMLGANIGTTLIVQVLSFDVSLASPVLLIAGVVAFQHGGRTRTRDLGRVATPGQALHCRCRDIKDCRRTPSGRHRLERPKGGINECDLVSERGPCLVEEGRRSVEKHPGIRALGDTVDDADVDPPEIPVSGE